MRVETVLDFLDADIEATPSSVKPMDSELLKRAKELTFGVEVDLDAPMSEPPLVQ